MQLSKRLETVAGMVQSGGVVADVGCDHGFTSIFLVKKDLGNILHNMRWKIGLRHGCRMDWTD